ncbi:MAG: hypothetical protein F6K55_03140 [Moorea sp. SIO4A3]|nr:hypothetical protein [Moorena sp. SIO4A3]
MFDIKPNESHNTRFLDFSGGILRWPDNPTLIPTEAGDTTLHLLGSKKFYYRYEEEVTENWVVEFDFKATDLKASAEAFVLFSRDETLTNSKVEGADIGVFSLVGDKRRGRYLSANSAGGCGMEIDLDGRDRYDKIKCNTWVHYRCPLVLGKDVIGAIKSLVFVVKNGEYWFKDFRLYNINSAPLTFRILDDLVGHDKDKNNTRISLFDNNHALSIQDNTYKAAILSDHVFLDDNKYLYVLLQTPILGEGHGFVVAYADTFFNNHDGRRYGSLKEFNLGSNNFTTTVNKFAIVIYGTQAKAGTGEFVSENGLITPKGYYVSLASKWVPYRLDLSNINFRLKRNNTEKRINTIGIFSDDDQNIDNVSVMVTGEYQLFSINSNFLPPFKPKFMFRSDRGLVVDRDSLGVLSRWVSDPGQISLTNQGLSNILIGSKTIKGFHPILGGSGLVSNYKEMTINSIGYCGWLVVQFTRLPQASQTWTLFEMEGINSRDKITVTLTGNRLQLTDELAFDFLTFRIIGTTDLCLITFYRDDTGCHIEVDDGAIFSSENHGIPGEHVSTSYRITLMQDFLNDSDKYEKGLLMAVFSDEPPDITSIKVLNRWVMKFFGIPEPDKVPF